MVKDLIFLSHACVLRERIIGLKNIGTNIQFCMFIHWIFDYEGSRQRERRRQERTNGRGGGRRVVESCRWSNDFQESQTNRGVYALASRVHFRNSSQGESHFTYEINVAHAWLYMHSLRITIPFQTNRIARKSIHRSIHLDMCAAHASLMHKNASDTHSLPCDVVTSFYHNILTTQIR